MSMPEAELRALFDKVHMQTPPGQSQGLAGQKLKDSEVKVVGDKEYQKDPTKRELLSKGHLKEAASKNDRYCYK